MAQSIRRGGIDPVDASVKACVNGGYGFLIILRAPSELPVSAANGPSSHAYWRDLQVTSSQFS
jgi:hypothetical protein